MPSLAPDLSAALAHAGLTEFFANCTPAHRREYLQWIDAAQRPATRQTRIEKAMQMLAQRQAEEQARTRAR